MIIALTTVMLIVLLVCTPLRVRAAFCLNLTEKTLSTRVKVFLLTLFKEQFTVDGKYIRCQGSVDTQVDWTQMDTKQGQYLIKAVVVDSVNLTFAVNYLQCNPFVMVALESFVGVSTAVATAVTNCRVRTSTQMANQTAIFGEIRLSVSLADVFLALARASVLKNATL